MTTAKSIPFNWVNSRGYTSWVSIVGQHYVHAARAMVVLNCLLTRQWDLNFY